MTEFDKIYLVWRKGAGVDRHAVGVLEKQPDGRHIFNYLPEATSLTQTEGFIPYTEFQDLHKSYNGNVAEIFGQRLMKTDRPDAAPFLKFWEVDLSKIDDKFYLLGKTQGLVPTDNFEFLAEYNVTENLNFVTEITGLSIYKFPRDTIKAGDVLRYELEPKNANDQYAVRVFKGDQHLGYIKRYHSKTFFKAEPKKLKLEVKATEQNGILKRAFVRVFI